MPEAVRKLTTKEILSQNLATNTPELLKNTKIILHNIRSMYNVGSVFRNADAFGIESIHLSGYTPIPPRDEISKTAIGAEKHVPWVQHATFSEIHQQFHRQEYLFIGIEQTNVSSSLIDFKPKNAANNKFCLVFGNEVTGIDQEVIPFIDQFVYIPQFGYKHSLNISVTTGIVLYALLEKSANR